MMARSFTRTSHGRRRLATGFSSSDVQFSDVVFDWHGSPSKEKAASDAAGDVGKVEPDFDAAEVGAFGADGCGDAGTNVAGGADVAREFWMDFAELGDFVHGGLVDFFLGVEAGAHGPFVNEMEERAGFVQADGFGVREEIEGDFRRDATIEELIFCVPGVVHGAVIDLFGAGIGGEEPRSDVVRI